MVHIQWSQNFVTLYEYELEWVESLPVIQFVFHFRPPEMGPVLKEGENKSILKFITDE